MWGQMGWCGVLECGEMGVAPVGEVCWGSRDVGITLPQSPHHDEAAPSNYPGARLFYLSTSHPTKSNPDMRNSKLAHTQAGF